MTGPEQSMTFPDQNRAGSDRSRADLARLSALDPMRDYEPAPDRRARATADLDQLFHKTRPTTPREPGRATSRQPGRAAAWKPGRATPPEPGRAAAWKPGRTKPRRLLLGGVAAGVIALAGTLLLPGGTGTGAYASWTATPHAVPGADVLPLAKACADGWRDGRTPPVAADVLLAERRGDATLLLVTKDRTDLTSCFVLDPARGPSGGDLLDTTGPAPAAERVRPESMGATEGTAGWYSSVIGRAGTGVTGVGIELPDGTEVGASLRDGWWAAWWPGREGGDADGVRIIVHTAGGARGYLPSELFE